MKKRIWCAGLALFWYTLCVWGQEMDLFEQIALQQVSEDVGLEKNPPIQLPDVKLPWDKNPQQFSFSSPKITTQKQLDKELARMRRQYEPFMKNLAPALPKTRQQKNLRQFEWKLLASDMRIDEEGNVYPIDSMETVNQPWQRVTIPHYTGPINNAKAIYRKTLHITEKQLSAEHIYLHFNGVDYRTEVFVNGKSVGKTHRLVRKF